MLVTRCMWKLQNPMLYVMLIKTELNQMPHYLFIFSLSFFQIQYVPHNKFGNNRRFSSGSTSKSTSPLCWPEKSILFAKVPFLKDLYGRHRTYNRTVGSYPLLSSGKVEKILKGSLDSIPSPSSLLKIQIMSRKIFLRCKSKTLLGVVNKLFLLPYSLK